MATATITTEMTTQVSIPASPTLKQGLPHSQKSGDRFPVPSRGEMPPYQLRRRLYELRLGFPEVRFAAGFDGGGKRIALALGDILAALDQFVGTFTELAGLALRVVAAFIGLLVE